jgi:hypothetical protein
MAKGQQRSGREAKKPKQNKIKAAPAASSAAAQVKSGGFTGGKKK